MARPLTDEEKLQIRQQLAQQFTQPSPQLPVIQPNNYHPEALGSAGEPQWQAAQGKLDDVIRKSNMEALQRLQARQFMRPQDEDEVARLKGQLGMK